MAEPSEATLELLKQFRDQLDLIEQAIAEHEILDTLETLISDLKTATLDPAGLDQKVALNSAIDAIGLLTEKFEGLFNFRDLLGAADAGLATIQGAAGGEELTAEQQLELLARFIGGIKEVLKIPGAGAIFEFYAMAIQSIVEYVPVLRNRTAAADDAGRAGIDFGADGPQPTGEQLAAAAALEEQLAQIREGKETALQEAEAARERSEDLREQLVAAGIEVPELTHSGPQYEVARIVKRALEQSGLMGALQTVDVTPMFPAKEYDEAMVAAWEAWEKFTKAVRDEAAPAAWNENDLWWLESTLDDIRDRAKWQPFSEWLQWDQERDGGLNNAWRPEGYETSLAAPRRDGGGLFASSRNRVIAAGAVAAVLVASVFSAVTFSGNDAASAVGVEGGDPSATAAAVVSGDPTVEATIAPLAISPIRVTDGPAVTEYVVDVGEPGPLTYDWSGASCGEAEVNGNTYVWDHAGATLQLSGGLLGNRQLTDDECGHAEDPNHSGATITVLVSGPTIRATCTYQGILSGVGPDCDTVRMVDGRPLFPPRPADPPPLPATGGGDPVAEAIDRTFAGGTSVAWNVDFSAGSCSEFPATYEQGVTIAGDKSLNEMTLFQAAHAPTGGYPEQHSIVLVEAGADSERYVIEFYLDGEQLGFRGVYSYQDRCNYEIDGQLG